MTAPTIPLVVLCLMLAFLSVWLLFTLRKTSKELNLTKKQVEHQRAQGAIDPGKFVGPLIRDQDPLGNILRFMYDYKMGNASLKQGFEACDLLLVTLEQSWGLKTIEGYRSIVNYDRARHRTSPGTHVNQGQRVIVVDPGWEIGAEPIKYSLVIDELRQ